MARHLIDRSISALFDGEGDPDLEAQRQDPGVQEQFRVLSRLKDALSVPEDVLESDPGFVVRFRRRLEQQAQRAAAVEAWRSWASRLVPLAATMLMAAAALIFSWSTPRDAFHELEVRALEDGMPGVTLETTLDEPVLRIALAEF